jgi:hypothetical protein
MHIKVRGGTVQHGEQSLCYSCKHATVVRGRSLQEEIVECAQIATARGQIRFPVTECSEYLHRNQPSIREMESIAWILRTDASRKRIGFVRSKDLEVSDRFVLDEDY